MHNGYAGESALVTETLTRYPNELRMRINRSLDTCSRSSFKIAVILVREVPARMAIWAWVIFSRCTIFLSRRSRACWTCHSFATAVDSPIAFAKSSGVLATIGLNLRMTGQTTLMYQI
jgi:hypothetical protein